MRQIFIALLLNLFYLPAIAQDVTLTKGETVTYLNKKLKETIGQKGFIKSITDISVTFVDNIMTIKWNEDNWSKEQKFNPLYIKSFPSGSSNTFWIFLTTKCNIERFLSDGKEYTEKRTTDNVNFPYLSADGSNFEKIKKAFLHLQALLKAEDDPFGN